MSPASPQLSAIAAFLCAFTAGCDLLTGTISGLGGGGGGGGSIADDPAGEVGTGEFADLPPFAQLDAGVAYLFGDSVFVIAADGSPPEDFSATLNAVGEGDDESVATSRSGEWMTMTSTRFECADFACLALVRRDLSYAHRVIANGSRLHPDGRAAVSDDAGVIVFPSRRGGPNETDLFAIVRSGATWGEPLLLTANSPEPYNDLPVISPDGQRVLFDCGPVPFSQNGTDICEVAVGGGGVTKLIDSDDNPLGGGGDFLAHHADYTPGGGVVFEADWGGEQIWERSVGGAFRVINGGHSNDNSPCAFGDGRVASLWLNRPGGSGVHELKLMDGQGGQVAVLTPNLDIVDAGMSCFGR